MIGSQMFSDVLMMSCGSNGSGGSYEFAWWVWLVCCAHLGYFWAFSGYYITSKYLQMEALVFDDPHVLDGRKVISDESVDFDDFRIWLMIQKEF